MKTLLPVGSIVRLKKAVRKAAIIGFMQKVSSGDGSEKQDVYDYLAVPYPEGFLGKGSLFLFNEDNIEEVCFKGYESKEGKGYAELIGALFEKIEEPKQDEAEGEDSE